MIGKQVCIIRVGFIFILVILLYSWDVLSLKHRMDEKKNTVVRDSFDINDDDVTELLWLNCKLEILRIKYISEDLDLCIVHQGSSITDTFNLKCQTEDKEKFREFLSMLHPELKLSLIHCLKRNSLLFDYLSKEEDGWVNEDFESLSSRLSINEFRRSLATSKRSGSKKKKADHQKIIIIAVSATATMTFLFAMLLFLCFYKCCGSSADDGHNDEKPLLSLSSSDRSIASSHKRYGSGDLDGQVDQQLNHISTSKTNSSSFSGKNGNDPILVTEDIKQQPSGRVCSALEVQTTEGSLLPPPPGRVVSTLKPPPGKTTSNLNPNPGKVEPLPPEPPVPPKPPTRAGTTTTAAASSSAPAPPPPPPISSGRKPIGPPPPPPPAPGGKRPGPPPPPQPKGGGGAAQPPPQPIPGKFGKAPPLAPKELGRPEDRGGKTKLKPFFWDKAQANPNSSMVWDQLKAGSFQFNEEMIETLFGYNADNKNKNKKEIKKDSSQDPSNTIIQIIDPKKSQNLSILLKALNVTIQEVCDALLEGNELPIEFLQTVLKMAPTQEEELKLRLFNGEVSQLGTADRFLKSLVDIPFAFKRMEALVFMITLEEEVTFAKESFENLEVACNELRKSRLFLKLLEAVLKTGNRMNSGTYRGGAQAFKLDTLLKLSDVRGADGKTTLLHFVVQEIIRSEGIRAVRATRESLSLSSVKSEDLLEDVPEESEDYYRSLGLQVVSGLSGGLENVKKAAGMDADNLTGTVARLGHSLMRTREFMNTDMKNLQEESGFHNTLKSFVKNAEVDVLWLLEEEKRIMGIVKSTGDYFHGNAGKDEGLRLFVIVRDFLVMLDKACREVKDAPKKKQVQKKEGPSLAPSSSDSRLKESPVVPKLAPSTSDSSLPMSHEMRQRFFPAIQERRNGGDSSSDDES